MGGHGDGLHHLKISHVPQARSYARCCLTFAVERSSLHRLLGFLLFRPRLVLPRL
jgi:hypothetical protein